MLTNKKYVFETPYNRNSALIAVPLYVTTYNVSFRYYNTNKYSYVKSRYKSDIPFVSKNKRVNKLKK